MELKLQRKWLTDNSTIGELTVNGKFSCYVLEDVVRAEKIYGKTAIPAGRYRITLTLSARFKRVLPLLNDVPNYAGVRIHPGNTAADTEGCLLPGLQRQKDAVLSSRTAFNLLFAQLTEANQRGEAMWIEIVNPSQQ